jgi:hypothetical protein
VFQNKRAIWTQFDDNHFIIYSSLKPYEGPWQPPINLSLPGQSAFNPQIATDALGNATAIWQRFDGHHFIIQTSTLLNEEEWQLPIDLSLPGQDACDPQIALDVEGNKTAIWSRFNGSHFVVQVSTRLGREEWQSPIDLSSPGQDACHPQIALDAKGNKIAIWSCFNGSHFVVQASTRLAGEEWQSPINLSFPGQDAFNPQIVLDAEGNATAVWLQMNGNHRTLQISFKSFEGNWQFIPSFLTAVERDISDLQIRVDEVGNLLVFWIQPHETENTILSIKKPAEENWSSNINKWTYPPESCDPKMTIDPAGMMAVVWQSFDGVYDHVQAAERPAFFLEPPPQVAVLPPSDFVGKVIRDQFGMTTYYTHRLKWKASPDPSVFSYQLFRNGILIATLPANQDYFTFDDHHRHKRKKDTYVLVAINKEGLQSSPLVLALP